MIDPVRYVRRVMLANAVLALVGFGAFAFNRGAVEASAIALIFGFSAYAYFASGRAAKNPSAD